MAHDVFISHASENKPIADAICAMLERAQIRCWIAPRDVRGNDWGEEIVRAIRDSQAVVLVFSGAANASRAVLNEVAKASEFGKPILPFRMENVQPQKGLEFHLASQHWLDAITPPQEQHIAKLVGMAQRILGATPDPQPIATRVESAEKPLWEIAWLKLYDLFDKVMIVLGLSLMIQAGAAWFYPESTIGKFARANYYWITSDNDIAALDRMLQVDSPLHGWLEEALKQKVALGMHNQLFRFDRAFELYGQLPSHEDDFTEAHLTTARFAECASRARARMLEKGETVNRLAIQLACFVGSNQVTDARAAAARLEALLPAWKPSGRATYAGVRHFLASHPAFTAEAPQWIEFFRALEKGDAAGLQRNLARFHP